MKLTVRTLVALLVLTGAAASTLTPSASAQHKIAATRVSVLPVPTCDPNDPNACGMGQH
jgi:hypothetical protein